jgi:repressor LexA
MRSSRYSEKEQAIYDYITETIEREGYSPTVRDIQQALGIKSTSTVHSYLARLEEKGMIRKDPGKSRTIQTERTPETCASLRVPILGKVRAGLPILAVENREGYVDVSLKGYPQKELFALRVTGDSMIEAGILEGDIIIVHQEAIAENGDVVVALVEDSATVKTFYKENGHFRLQPENPTMEPIIVDDVVILGRVVSSMRFY